MFSEIRTRVNLACSLFSLWSSFRSKMSRSLIQQNSTLFIMATNTQFSYLETSQSFSMKCSLHKTNVWETLRDCRDPEHPCPGGQTVRWVSTQLREGCFHKASIKAIVIAMFFKLPRVTAHPLPIFMAGTTWKRARGEVSVLTLIRSLN